MKVSTLCLGFAILPVATGMFALTGCSSSPPTQTETADIAAESDTELKVIEHDSPSIKDLLSSSYGYAVFPSVSKGGAGVEVGGGHGSVYEQGQYYGVAQLTMAAIGADVGGETYDELLVFQTKEAFDTFVNAGLKFDASASAVAIQDGVATAAKFENGVAAFKYNSKGLMLDAAIGGQQFTVKPAKTVTTTAPAM